MHRHLLKSVNLSTTTPRAHPPAGIRNCMDAFRLYTYQTTSSPYHPILTTHISTTTNNMPDITFSDLAFISREDLAEKLRTSPSAPQIPDNMAIIDVRDSDHIGGHIRGSTWVPSGELDYKIPELVRRLRGKEEVVFHCALSQQRGPGAALRYLRERRRAESSAKDEKEEGEKGEEGKEKKMGEQRVLVLRGGFTQWQEKYGADQALTEGWQKDIWEFGY